MKILPSWLRTMISGSLPDDAQLADQLTLIGIAVEGIDRSGPETVFEMEITTNRVDAMNHYGIARECSALYDLDLKAITPQLPKAGNETFDIKINEPSLCARYTSMVLRDVQIKPATGEIAQRFAALSLKPINNAADATNYTLFELGHPTHVFDLDKLAGGKIIVRLARKGEKLKTLDGIERTLFEDDLVIADAEKPVALAGVIGGEDTKVTETTRNILIESAWFDTATVRRTSRRHAIHTDASHRFERGADFNATTLACQRVAKLILQQSGTATSGQVDKSGTAALGCVLASPLIDVIARKIEIPPIELRLSQVRRILGKDISEAEIRRILTRLGFKLLLRDTDLNPNLEQDSFEVEVPTWRLDISREIDLLEEIARVHGFNQFENHLPAFSGAVVDLPTSQQETKLRQTLLALGYNEAISNTFSSREDVQRLTPGAKPVELENPLSEERAVMRTSLVPGMLDMLEYNLNRDQNSVRLFETGNVFRAEGDHVVQTKSACFAFTAPVRVLQSAKFIANLDDIRDNSWPNNPFYLLKGDVESLLATYSNKATYAPEVPKHFHPGRSAQISLRNIVIGYLGELSPSAYGNRKLKQPIYLAELDLERLYAQPVREPGYKPLSRYPAVERDFSFLIPDQVQWNQIYSAVTSLAIPELKDFEIVEIFRGKSISPGHYSALFRSNLQANDRTLRDDEVARWSDQIISTITALGATLRST